MGGVQKVFGALPNGWGKGLPKRKKPGKMAACLLVNWI